MQFRIEPPLLPEILALNGKWRAADIAVVSGNDQWTWREFTSFSHQFAHGLRARGIETGDRIGVLMGNGLPMVQAIFGVIAAGAVVVPLNVSVADEAAVTLLRDADVSAVVACSIHQPRVEGMRDALPVSSLYITPKPHHGWLSFADVTAQQPSTLPETGLCPTDLINIIYSSGTTGLPKGIAHDHVGRRDWVYDVAIALRYHGGARTLITIGLYSNISWVAMLSTLMSGGCIYVEEQFNEHRFIERVEQHRITHTAMVPIQFQRVIEAAEQNGGADFSSMQAMMSCGSPLRETLKRAIFQHFPCGIIELYGLTEGIITTLEPEHAEGRWSSVGRPLMGTDICIVSESGDVLPAGEAGEICSRGRIGMPGYWRRDDANEEATFRDADGVPWMRSGDIGYFDEEGFFFIVDRKKDMILSGGQNIYPQDIEAVMVTHEAVFDVAVIGLKSEKWGETPVALVVRREDQQLEAGDLREWVNTRVGKQQRLADVLFIEELPRNPNGKVLKRELREQFGDKRYG
ncbi:class I adenylate-forming enzyme family protein [Luminiphilus syltensis]|uniref:class I adenylate-forming enzyme family protein n=1 Tax=Luminiphilus syltensis TaxID=1341119 RepID=UPI0002E9A5BC|nr:class I adenylate-forming enzyme family protein [Luminiphilus syltensis]